MAVELEIKLGTQCFSRKDLYAEFAEIEGLLRGVYDGSEILIDTDLIDSVGKESRCFSISYGRDAKIECTCYFAGDEEDMGSEGGWWLCVAILNSNQKSKILMLAISACISKISKSDIVDESNLFSKFGRYLTYEQALMILKGCP